ncbi:hypothetical protein TrVFT333_006425 [Trichoderma virens FT-333]|nr:hypothetical protein TrVFT333_006425 [Trichoderma virens FT-333]
MAATKHFRAKADDSLVENRPAKKSKVADTNDGDKDTTKASEKGSANGEKKKKKKKLKKNKKEKKRNKFKQSQNNDRRAQQAVKEQLKSMNISQNKKPVKNQEKSKKEYKTKEPNSDTIIQTSSNYKYAQTMNLYNVPHSKIHAPSSLSNGIHSSALTQFWSNYLAAPSATRTPTLPYGFNNIRTELSHHLLSLGATTQNYEEARKQCEAKVLAAVSECRRTNMMFVDFQFDIEGDLINHQNCLYSLDREWLSKEDEKINCACTPKVVKRSVPRVFKKAAKAGDAVNHEFNHSSPFEPPKSVHRVSWIFKKPQFVVDTFSGYNTKQGVGGNCWWVAAVASIAHRRDIMEKICVARNESCGIYGFVFHKDQGWISTVIDDNLYLSECDIDYDGDVYDPRGDKARLHRKQRQTNSEALHFARSADPNETWFPLLEKAYAKVHGDYQALNGGWFSNGIEDLTGGITTVLPANGVLEKERLWNDMIHIGKACSEFVFGLSVSENSACIHKNGLITNHTYSILAATEVVDEFGVKTYLLKIRYVSGELLKGFL